MAGVWGIHKGSWVSLRGVAFDGLSSRRFRQRLSRWRDGRDFTQTPHSRGGGPHPHLARKRQQPSALFSEGLATATTLRKNAGTVRRFRALWLFSLKHELEPRLRTNSTQPPGEMEHCGGWWQPTHPLPQQNAGQTRRRGRRRGAPAKRGASRQPKGGAPADSPGPPPGTATAVWTGPRGPMDAERSEAPTAY